MFTSDTTFASRRRAVLSTWDGILPRFHPFNLFQLRLVTLESPAWVGVNDVYELKIGRAQSAGVAWLDIIKSLGACKFGAQDPGCFRFFRFGVFNASPSFRTFSLEGPFAISRGLGCVLLLFLLPSVPAPDLPFDLFDIRGCWSFRLCLSPT